ncbi:MAG: sigma-54-dependent Fis family transcriptional regulator [Bryobacterales bacterium]|nr:sigma-54-dependent Fis family transcriptional regulator [Bryobacterales bacterium]
MVSDSVFVQPVADELRILWVSPGEAAAPGREVWRQARGTRLESAATGEESLLRLRGAALDAVVGCFPLPGWTPESWLEEVRRVDRAVHVVICDEQGSTSEAVRLVKLGADQYFDRRVAAADVAREVALLAERRRPDARAPRRQRDEPWRTFLIGRSRGMENLNELVRLVGPRRSTVLVSGETGTGKELVARALHMASPRAAQPMVAVNCSALPENLLEAELFGHVKGAFTGAAGHRVGRFEQAHRSTLFLDEIGELPLELQAKLLRVLQEREFQRLGSSETVRVDVRVVAATNVDLAENVAQGRFREDLYYRLNVVPLHLPPLRERRGDVAALAEHFIAKICADEGLPAKLLTREAIERLESYSWPGNVRQLQNAIEMAVALSGERRTLYPADFPLAAAPSRPGRNSVPVVALPDDGLDFEETVSEFERAILKQALERTAGNKKQAAEMLRLKRTTLSAKWKTLEATA